MASCCHQLPLPRAPAGDVPQGDPISAWETLCPVRSFQAPATPSLQGLCPASQEGAGNPSLSSRGRPKCSPCLGSLHLAGEPFGGGGTRVFNPDPQEHPRPLTSPSHPPHMGSAQPTLRVRAASPTRSHRVSLFSPALPRPDPAAKGEFRSLRALCIPAQVLCVPA